MCANAFAMAFEVLHQLFPALGRQKGREALAGYLVAGQDMGLLVLQHLDAVFQQTQEAVGLAQLLGGVGFDDAFLAEYRQRLQQALGLQSMIAAAAENLEGLHEELDLADPAAADLQVVAGALATGLGIDALLQPCEAVEHAVVVVAPVDEGAQDRGDGLAVGLAAGDDAGLDHRVLLPVAPVELVILLEGGVAEHHRAGFAPGTQAQVHAVDEAVLGGVVEAFHQLARNPGEELGMAEFAEALEFAFLAIGADQVDVGAEIQLVAAKLAHADHIQLHRLPPGVDGLAVAFRQQGLDALQGSPDQHIGQVAELLQGGFDGLPLAQVETDDAQQLPMTEQPKGLVHLLRRGGVGQGLLQLRVIELERGRLQQFLGPLGMPCQLLQGVAAADGQALQAFHGSR